MVRIAGKWTGKHQSHMIHGPSGQTIETDAPLDNGGTGQRFSPTDLLASAYASCMLTIMSIRATKMGLSMEGTEFSVEKKMTSEAPRRIAALNLQFQMPSGFSKSDFDTLVEAAKNCPVALSVSSDIETSFEFSS